MLSGRSVKIATGEQGLGLFARMACAGWLALWDRAFAFIGFRIGRVGHPELIQHARQILDLPCDQVTCQGIALLPQQFFG